jgi:hypothetical protein
MAQFKKKQLTELLRLNTDSSECKTKPLDGVPNADLAGAVD